MVWEDGGTEHQAISALLHDAIEDAGQSHASIAERFGSDVADIVRDCTDTTEGPPPGEKEPWLLRKTRYIASLEHKPDTSLLVTAADYGRRHPSTGAAAAMSSPDDWEEAEWQPAQR
jgi:(p)ppGpp synthase/HD superfamily hydrolase